MRSRKVALVFGSGVFGALVSYVATMLIGRALGPSALGVIAFALSATGLLGVITSLGLPQAHVKIAAEGHDTAEYVGAFLSIQLVLTGMALLLALAALPWVVSRYSHDEQVVLGFLLVAFLLGNIVRVSDLTFAARQETAKQQMPLLLANLVFVMAVWTTLRLGGGVIGIALAYLLKSISWCAWSFWMFRSYPIHRPGREHLIRYLRFALPLMVAAIFGIVAINLDSILVRTAWGTRELGYYFASQRLVLGFALLADAVAVVLMPSMSASFALGDVSSLVNVSTRAQRYLILAMLPIAAVVMALAQPILRFLLGQEYVAAAATLRLLTVYAFFRIINQPYSDLILASDKSSVVGKIGVLFATVALLLYATLIPKGSPSWPAMGWGAVGGAAALTTAIVMSFFLFVHYTRRLYGKEIRPFLIQPLLWIGLVGSGLYLVASHLSFGWPELIGLGALGLLLGYGGFIFFSMLTRSDLMLLLGTLDPKSMWRYITSETK